MASVVWLWSLFGHAPEGIGRRRRNAAIHHAMYMIVFWDESGLIKEKRIVALRKGTLTTNATAKQNE